MTDRLPALLRQAGLLLLAFLLGGLLLRPCGAPEAPHTDTATAAAQVWTCSMHPQIRQPEPGLCPLCGMDLIPATSDAAGADADGRVVLSARAQALARLRTTVVQRQGDAAAEVRLLGRVEPDETTRKNVTTWIGGRIERLHVNVTGEQIRAGTVIATLYSPEVYGAHQDLIAAHQQVARLADSAPATRLAAEQALRAARERLRLLGVPEADIDRMEAATAPSRTVAIRSPFGGTVIERLATEGAYVGTGEALYRVADLRTLWVQLDAYESDLPRLSEGQTVRLSLEGLPGETFEGRIAFIEPMVDLQRRIARVRVEVANPDGRLRPGMFVEAVVAASAAEADATTPLVIPATAPLFTGRRSLVYVETRDADGQLGYAPRTVRLGPRLGEVYPVVSGLSEGERVVTRGAFALDADLQIRGGDSMMSAPTAEATAPEAAPLPLAAAERAQVAAVVTAYLAVQRALAEDDLATAQAAAEGLEAAVAAVTLAGRAAAAWPDLAEPLRSHARHVAAATDLEGARAGFEPLSLGIEALLRQLGNPLDTEVHVAFCPMAMGSEGARWVQQGTTIDNAYFGASMRTCGEIRTAVSPGTYLAAPPADAAGDGHGGHAH